MNFLVSFTIIVLFILLFKLYPMVSSQNQDIDLEKFWKYKKWEIFSIIPLFIFIISASWIFYKIFIIINLSILASSNANITMLLHDSSWYLPSVLIGYSITPFLISFLYQLILKDNYAEYLNYTLFRGKSNGLIILKYIIISSVIITSSFCLFALDSKVGFYKDYFETNEFKSLNKNIRYDYKNLNEVYIRKYSKNNSDQTIIFEFKDYSEYELKNSWNYDKKELIKFIENDVGIIVKEYEFY